MKRLCKITGILLCLTFLLSAVPIGVSAEKPVYVNFGDSVAWGRVDQEESDPEFAKVYNKETESYRGLLAAYWGAEAYSYARRGMQTTDVLYQVDETYQKAVDSGEIEMTSWYTDEYPPNDGTDIAEIRENLSKAKYITLCLNDCDYFSYPLYVKNTAMGKIDDPGAIREELKGYLLNGKLDSETYFLLCSLLRSYRDQGKVICNLILDILEGFDDYYRNYPRVVKTMREQNPTADIILIGRYVTIEQLSFLWEDESSGKVLRYINRLLTNYDRVIQEAAAEYQCYYVDTMGVECIFHPTVKGYRQIADRVISVMSGDSTYAGSMYGVLQVSEKIRNQLDKVFCRRTLFAGGNLSRLINRIWS